MSSLPPAEQPVASSHHVSSRRSSREHSEMRYRPFVPLLLFVFATMTWSGFQCYQLVHEKESLATTYSNQTRQFEDSGKMRSSLDSIARDTAVLAAMGNPSAKLVVDELARRGVKINPTAPGPAPK